MPAETVEEQFIDALKTRALTVAAGATYHYDIAKAARVREFVQTQFSTSVVGDDEVLCLIRTDPRTAREDTSFHHTAELPVFVVVAQKWSPSAGEEDPWIDLPAGFSEREKVAGRMLRDLEVAIATDIFFGGLVENTDIIRTHTDVYQPGWAAGLMELLVRYSYPKEAP